MNSPIKNLSPSRPSISEIFTDPYEADLSFWVHAKIEPDVRDRLAEADRYLADGDYGRAKKPLGVISRQLPEPYRASFLKRAAYNQTYLQPYEPRQQQIDLPPGLKDEFKAKFTDSRAVLNNVQPPPAIGRLLQRTRKEMSELYGADFIRSGVSVRYANHLVPSPYKCDNTLDVESQLLSVMHHDEKKGVTSIVYLTDVDDQTGCFSYLEGSNRIKQSVTIRSLHETLMHDMAIKTPEAARASGIADGLAGTIAYGENLPPEKREIARRYVHKLVGPAGTAISFAGNVLIHGGGWPIKGERIAMFIDHVGLIRQRAKYLLPYFLHLKSAA